MKAGAHGMMHGGMRKKTMKRRKSHKGGMCGAKHKGGMCGAKHKSRKGGMYKKTMRHRKSRKGGMKKHNYMGGMKFLKMLGL